LGQVDIQPGCYLTHLSDSENPPKASRFQQNNNRRVQQLSTSPVAESFKSVPGKKFEFVGPLLEAPPVPAAWIFC